MNTASLKIFTAALFCLLCINSIAQSGNLKGKIVNQSTKQPVAEAIIRLEHTSINAISDSSGIFEIPNLLAGTYSVTISSMGFQTKNIPELIIVPSKNQYTEIELLESSQMLKGITVKVSRYQGESNPAMPVSTFSYSREEIFRNPGAQGDIMRALSNLPGVVSSGAQFSAIAARGQGTQDNVYMVDDIPMYNLSHLEAEGFNSGFNDPNGGRYSIFAPRVIDNVLFQNGGFDAGYGRKSSSYLGLGIKEGNKAGWSYTGQFDLLGGTLMADGPVSKKTSVFASGRYYNFGAIIGLMNMKNSGSVSFGDYILKTTTEINANNKLSFLAMYHPERPIKTLADMTDTTNIHDDNSAGSLLFNHKSSKAVLGLNLRTLINAHSYWKNILYFRRSTVDNKFGYFTPLLDTAGLILDAHYGPSEDDLRSIKNNQQELGYRSILNRRFSKINVMAGVEAMLVNVEFSRTLKHTDTIFSFRETDLRPDLSTYYQILDPTMFNASYGATRLNSSAYLSASWTATPWLTLNPGLRYDYTGFTEQHTIAPRLSGSVLLSAQHSINFSSGLYYQDPGYQDIAGQQLGNRLKNERSIQSILGYKFQISSDLKFVIEGWHKQFDNLIVQPNRTQSFLTNNGTGFAYGMDVSVTKRLSRKWYGQASYSYMASKRNDNNGTEEYDYTFSVPHNLSLMGSYKPNNRWILSGKFRYSTGRPTDKYLVHADVLNDPNRVRYSQEILGTNTDRLPAYISLDMRVDYNIPLKRGTFSAFVDLGNITNRFNVNSRLFLPNTGRTFNIGLGLFPTFGVRLEL